MSAGRRDACILNGGGGAWAFAPLAERLAEVLRLPVSDTPRARNYLLFYDDVDRLAEDALFVPLSAVRVAADKRLQAIIFREHGVPAPETVLIDEWREVEAHVADRQDVEWCLKYPTSCGAGGHRLFETGMSLPPDWPRPFVVQRFVRMQRPEVHRVFAAGGELFGWVERSFGESEAPSPWVAHAQGARYRCQAEGPASAVSVASAALPAVGLMQSFGCADLIRGPDGEWPALEVGTNGLVNHVDRDFGDAAFLELLEGKLAAAVERGLSE